MSNISAGEDVVVKGFAVFELVHADGTTEILYPNQVTTLAKAFMFARGWQPIFKAGERTGRGSLIPTSTLINDNAGQGSDPNDTATIYLLNDNTALNGDSRLIPVYNPDFTINEAKIIGYANQLLNSTVDGTYANTKLGVVDFPKGAQWLLKRTISRRYKFAPGQATGTINRLAMGVGPRGYGLNGLCTWEPLSQNGNFFGTNYPDSCFADWIAIPGLGALTGPNEVLMGGYSSMNSNYSYYAKRGTPTHSLDLSTGNITKLASNDARINVTLPSADTTVLIDGNFAYWVATDSTYYQPNYTYSTSCILYKTNLTTFAQTSRTITGSTTSSVSDTQTCVFKSGTNYYYSNGNGGNYVAFDPNTLADITPAVTLSPTAMGIPTALLGTSASAQYFQIGNLGANFIVRPTSVSNSLRAVQGALECSNITNIAGSIVDLRPGCASANVVNLNGKKLAFGNGFNFEDSTYNDARAFRDQAKMANYEDHGNLFSYIDLSTPITKASTDTLYVTYYYQHS